MAAGLFQGASMDNPSDTPTSNLEERLKALLDVERFEPPAVFAEQALVNQ